MSCFLSAADRSYSMAHVTPAPMYAATSPPILVPITSDTPIPASTMARYAPACAIPFTPPPPITRKVFCIRGNVAGLPAREPESPRAQEPKSPRAQTPQIGLPVTPERTTFVETENHSYLGTHGSAQY